MTREILFEPEARMEFDEAIDWYDAQNPGLGDRFEAEINATLDRIVKNPERFRPVSRNLRIARVKVFNKYAVYFRVEPTYIGVVAVFHGSRNPEDLTRRLK